MGSAPGESMKISGVIQILSPYDPGRSNGGGSMNCLPIFFSTKFCMAGIIWTGIGDAHLIPNQVSPLIDFTAQFPIHAMFNIILVSYIGNVFQC